MTIQKSKKIIGLVLILILLSIAIFYAYTKLTSLGKYDSFAKCLTENEVIMYGTVWCSHCKNQKFMFGNSFQYINYVECTENQKECANAGIEGYPTWVFPNNTKKEGEISIEEIAKLSGCELKNDE